MYTKNEKPGVTVGIWGGSLPQLLEITRRQSLEWKSVVLFYDLQTQFGVRSSGWWVSPGTLLGGQYYQICACFGARGDFFVSPNLIFRDLEWILLRVCMCQFKLGAPGNKKWDDMTGGLDFLLHNRLLGIHQLNLIL